MPEVRAEEVQPFDMLEDGQCVREITFYAVPPPQTWEERIAGTASRPVQISAGTLRYEMEDVDGIELRSPVWSDPTEHWYYPGDIVNVRRGMPVPAVEPGGPDATMERQIWH